MSYITITIETDNAAFDNFETETARILNDLASRVKYGSKGEHIPVMDINGNTVGSFDHIDHDL